MVCLVLAIAGYLCTAVGIVVVTGSLARHASGSYGLATFTIYAVLSAVAWERARRPWEALISSMWAELKEGKR